MNDWFDYGDAGGFIGALADPFGIFGGRSILGTEGIGEAMGDKAKQIDPNAPGGSLDTSQADAQRNKSQALISLLQNQATTGDGAWKSSFDKAVQNAKGNASALGQDEASQARAGAAGALRNIGNAQAGIGQRAVGQENALRTEAKNNAQDQLSQLLSAQGTGDINQATNQAAVAQQVRQSNLALADQAKQNQGSTMNAASSALAFLSKGGRVPGEPVVFGDSSKNDVISAKLSPEEIVLPRSVTLRPDAPSAAARFVAAIKEGRGPKAAAQTVRHLADGGSTGISDAEPTAANRDLLTFLPHVGQAAYFNQLTGPQAASIQNGGLLDTTNYAQTRGQMDSVAAQLAARAKGGNSIADTVSQQQSDDAMAKAMAAQNGRHAALANILQAQAAESSRTAGEAGRKRGAEQSAGQRALGDLDLQRRMQEQALAKAAQQQAFGNTELNAHLTLANQQALRNMAASAGQAAAGLASAGKEDPGLTPGGQADFAGERGGPADLSGGRSLASEDNGAGFGPDGAPSIPEEYNSYPGDTWNPPNYETGEGMAHGGVIEKFASAARRMAKGGRAEDVAHLTILVPAPAPMMVSDGRGFAQAARRYADGGRVVTDSGLADRTLNQMRAEYDAGKARPDLGPANVPPSGGVGPSLPRIATMRHAQAAEHVAAEPSPLEKLAQTVQAGARMAASYATVPHFAEGGGVPDAEAVAPDAGTGDVPYTPGPAADAGTPAIPAASFRPASTIGLDRVGPTGQVIPWEKSLEREATTPPPAKLPPMKPPAVAPDPAAKPAVPAHVASPSADALHAPYANQPDSFDAEMRAKRQEGEFKAQQAADLAKAQGAYQEQLQRNALQQAELVKRADTDAQALMGHYNDAVEQMKHIDTSVDPGRFWASRTTGQKVLGIIGMAFGAMGSRDGTNRAAELLGKAIDRDVDAQKAEAEARLKKGEHALAATQTAYAMNRQLFQNDLAANAATKASLLDLSINQAEQIKTAYAGKLAGPEADSFIAQLKQARDKYIQQAQSQVVENNLKRSQTAENYAQAQAAGMKGSGLTPERQKAIDEVETQARNIRNNLDKARAIIQRSGTFELMGTDEPELRRALNFIANDTAKLKDPGSTNREAEIENAKKDLGLKGGELTVRNEVALKLLNDFEKDIMQRRKNEYETRGIRAPALAPSQPQLEE